MIDHKNFIVADRREVGYWLFLSTVWDMQGIVATTRLFNGLVLLNNAIDRIEPGDVRLIRPFWGLDDRSSALNETFFTGEVGGLIPIIVRLNVRGLLVDDWLARKRRQEGSHEGGPYEHPVCWLRRYGNEAMARWDVLASNWRDWGGRLDQHPAVPSPSGPAPRSTNNSYGS